jgi:predicted ribosome quality control (RQC) complex YloA/Tae2 family protein
MAKSKYRAETRTATLDSVISDAFSEVECLNEEMQDWKASMEDKPGLAATDKFQRVSDACDTLEEHTDAPDVSAMLAELPVTYVESVRIYKKAGPSRAIRAGNAVNRLDAVIEALSEIIDDEDKAKEIAEVHNAKADEVQQEAEELRDQLEEHKSEIDGVEFPGMFG